MPTYRNLAVALPCVLDALLHDPASQIHHSRVGTTRELTGYTVHLTHPLERVALVPYRRANPFALVAETAWLLAGRDDIAWLHEFLPRAPDYSDDGVTWRAAYGPRLRAWPRQRGGTLDQLAAVCHLLRTEPATRRAVVSLWNPDLDLEAHSLDVPCNVLLHFLQRGGALSLHVTVRSNDAWWGWSGINTFAWSVLLELVAYVCGYAMGSLTTTIGSLHLYERHWQVAQKLVEHRTDARPAPPGLPWRVGLDVLDARLASAMAGVRLLDDPASGTPPRDVLDVWGRLIDIYRRVVTARTLKGAALQVELHALPPCDIVTACRHYLATRQEVYA